MVCAIGIDVGATKVAVALVDSATGRVERSESFSTSLEGGPQEVLDVCVRLCESLAEGVLVSAVGVGICEIVDPGGAIVSACSIDWRELDVVSALSHVAPTVLESDVRAAAIGEARHGAGRERASFLYVNAGSGTSSCFVVEGEAHVGAHGAAIMIGAGPLDAEAVAGGLAIASRAGTSSVEDVVRASSVGNQDAAGALREAGAALGGAIAFSVNLLDPEAVILGGGVGLNAAEFRDSLETAMRSQIWLEAARNVPLLEADLGGWAGVVGAASIASDRVQVGAL